MSFVQHLQDCANNGKLDSQLVLSLAYSQGWGINKNPSLALNYMKMAADNASNNDINASAEVANMYYSGIGTAVNLEQAFIYFKKAAGGGHLLSNFFLGMMYADGQGTAKDVIKAKEHFKVLADKGFSQAQCALNCLEDFT
jgi:hypothetical protein